MKRRPSVLCAMLSVLSFFWGSAAFANPFTDGKPATAKQTLLQTLPNSPFMQEILHWQQVIHEAMTQQITSLHNGTSLTPLWLLLAISFAYGVFHVLAPGHGKIIVSSYFLGHRARWREAITAGLVMAFGHTITAIVIVVGLYMVLGFGQLQVLAEARYAEILGYGLITAVGFWLLWRVLRRQTACAHCGHHHGHTHHDHSHHDHASQANAALPATKSGLSLFAATSLVPCSGSMIILLFTLAHQILWAGVLAVIAVAAGMAITVTAIALGAIALNRGLLGHGTATNTPWRQTLQRFMQFGAALIVLATGGLLLTGTILSMVTF